ncbi:UDP-N-acetyl-alpha-D-glucosamine C6 dehydratase [Paenibacillus plantiphilus]|uniref:UDP-N-acetyl-alpha-D-glucosamine C6 dehydratase n=1 Tax=Paenibacillus plantiphilus TaxID=2905650 RepID=A0ABM9CAX8_9BACL|nr:nucleoside-diphosphate sugar epimerase/dehydratase [Paenibacillus plantiphilus]CAH1206829.1 UDP-N-acetyl-alpha-D-glucosamine C6 dehydratase [Paenibacillus plantiphilus]
MFAAYRTHLLIVLDLSAVVLSLAVSFWMQYANPWNEPYPGLWLVYTVTAGVIGLICMLRMKLHRRIWQYAGVSEMLSIIAAALWTGIVPFLLTNAIYGWDVPMLLLLHHLTGMIFMMAGPRLLWRAFCDKFGTRRRTGRHRALIIGAGSCGTLIAKELLQNDAAQFVPVGFIDDDPYKTKLTIYELPVYGGRHDITRIAESERIDEIIIAMPSVSKSQISAIINICKQTKARLKIVPDLQELIQGRSTVNRVRDVSVEDLLGRDPIRTDLDNIANYVEGKTVLITGAGGSIGSELCRQIAPFDPKRLLLLGHGENSIYTIEMELRATFPELVIETVIADVQDRKRMEDVFKKFHPQVVFHAAAHKHVPLMERNPSEAIKNNVFGTRNVAECADQFAAERFVLISTDKAVNPTSIMGTTKRIAEMFIQSLDKHSRTKFVAVRFGNVLGSRGSVIPRFKDQIEKGGPVTVTHPEMVRYFMTIPEAVQLVIQAGAFASGGEVFILDMGKPVKIYDLAADLIRLSGYEPNVDMDIQFSGIREGEKLFEELLTNEEGLSSTKHDRIFIGKPTQINRSELEFEIRKLEQVLGQQPEQIRALLKHLVPTYSNVS